HDIRRGMRTGLSALPVPSDVAELVIAHSRPGLRKVYDQYAFEAEKRRALELWAARLRDIVETPPANLVELAGGRRGLRFGPTSKATPCGTKMRPCSGRSRPLGKMHVV